MISAILLAAGQSKRMGGENKLVKKIHGLPLIQLSVKNILQRVFYQRNTINFFS